MKQKKGLYKEFLCAKNAKETSYTSPSSVYIHVMRKSKSLENKHLLSCNQRPHEANTIPNHPHYAVMRHPRSIIPMTSILN